MTTLKAFQLSGISLIGRYAGLQMPDANVLNRTVLAEMNPYIDGDERGRWTNGFMEGSGDGVGFR